MIVVAAAVGVPMASATHDFSELLTSRRQATYATIFTFTSRGKISPGDEKRPVFDRIV